MTVSASLFSPGGIAIRLALAPEHPTSERRARRVTLASSRPTGFSGALFTGRAPADVPGMVRRLHSLCGHAHGLASEAAIVAASGGEAEAIVAARFDVLVAERLGEHLRSTFTGPGLGQMNVATTPETLADVRSVLASARAFEAGPVDGTTVKRIRDGVARLGLSIDRRGRLRVAPKSWAAALLARVGPATGDVFLAVDRLAPQDDEAVIARLAADPKGFSSAPTLAGRCPETGPAARRALAGGGIGPGVVDGRARLAARLAEIAEAANLLAAPEADKARVAADWVTARRSGPTSGWAAVESPRGRLHHYVRLDDDGRIAGYAVLAPTEWNFHADGPLAATLLANHWGGSDDRARAERIAALFDPCVGFDVEIADASEDETDA